MPEDIPAEYIRLLRQFVALCDAQPELLQAPELDFFRDWLSKLGATNSAAETSSTIETEDIRNAEEETTTSSTSQEETPKVESEAESELELDMTGVVEGDNDAPQAMWDTNIEVTDAMLEQADVKRSEAQSKLSEGAFEEAISLFTQAIENNPQSAILYAKRAQCYIKLQKPNAAIRDCDRALELNENSQQALKWRGKANRMLGNWEAAYRDFCKAQISDFDEDVQAWLKEVEVNAKKLGEHKRKYERRREEKEIQAKRERIRKAQEAYAKAQHEEDERRAREQQARFAGGQQYPGFPGGMGGMDEADLGGLGAVMNDPEILEALQDPDVQKAFADVSTDPSKLAAHQSNPKVRKVMEKLAKKFGGAGGPMSGGFPGFPGGMGNDFGGAGDVDANDLD
ncbi:unnamed protein product [Adineta ricciae]|uniref:STI1 domain-containing protein n=1 Tax=Adineta ricciae TaxID=249248 RepID=A0A814TVR6_ADIRI|nr:unnamed protein product [Adineta ricciae]CAF1166483.1 unnamed protein product [Adineta ricciae]